MVAVVLGRTVKVPGEGGSLLVGEAGQGLQALPQREDQLGHQGQATQGYRQVPAPPKTVNKKNRTPMN